MFADFKNHRVGVESAHPSHFLRRTRLTLIVALPCLWLVAFGSFAVERGQSLLEDRADCGDLSFSAPASIR